MPQEIDDIVHPFRPSFTARREAQKEAQAVESFTVPPLRVAPEPTPLYPFDPVGAATAAQATHEATIEGLRAELTKARNQLEHWALSVRDAVNAQLQAERARDDARSESQKLLDENRELKADVKSLIDEINKTTGGGL